MTVTSRLAHLERRISWQHPRWMTLLREAACEAVARAEATSGAKVLTWAGLATSMEARGFEGSLGDLRELAKIQGAELWQLQWWAVKGQWWAAKTVDGAQVLYRPEEGELAPAARRRRDDGAVVEFVEAREQFVAVDIESTGFSPTNDRIIEVGLVAFRGGREIASWSSLVDPERKVPRAVTQLTGLSSRDLRGAPTFEQVAAHVHRYLSRARVVVAHNAPFDKRMLAGEFARLGLEWPDVELICTQAQAKELTKAGALAALPNVKLDTVCRAMGVELADHHRAEDDARACGRLLLAFDARRREIGQQQEMWG